MLLDLAPLLSDALICDSFRQRKNHIFSHDVGDMSSELGKSWPHRMNYNRNYARPKRTVGVHHIYDQLFIIGQNAATSTAIHHSEKRSYEWIGWLCDAAIIDCSIDRSFVNYFQKLNRRSIS